jgi:type III pantothenate kinase
MTKINIIMGIDIGNTLAHFRLYSSQHEYLTAFTLSTKMDQAAFEKKLIAQFQTLKHHIISRVIMVSVLKTYHQTVINQCKYFWPSAQLTWFDDQCCQMVIPPDYPPYQMGKDRIAAVNGALARYPKQNLIIADAGTATTLTAVDASGYFAGGAILPGLKTALIGLINETCLPIRNADDVLNQNAAPYLSGNNTLNALYTGIIMGHRGSIREIINDIMDKQFRGGFCRIIGTGGYIDYINDAGLFDHIEPDLIFAGLLHYLEIA